MAAAVGDAGAPAQRFEGFHGEVHPVQRRCAFETQGIVVERPRRGHRIVKPADVEGAAFRVDSDLPAVTASVLHKKEGTTKKEAEGEENRAAKGRVKGQAIALIEKHKGTRAII